MEIEEQHIETTTISHGHMHLYIIDEKGDGETTKTIFVNGEEKEHTHIIYEYELEKINNHKHKIIYEEEEPEEDESHIKTLQELNVTLNTGAAAKIEYLTKKIQGELDSIIISSNEFINVRISLENHDGVVLYLLNGFTGEKYLSLRNDTTYFNNERSQFANAKWLLNDKLVITVEGNYNALCSFVIRWT